MSLLKRLKALGKNLYLKLTGNKGSEWAPWKGQGLFNIPLERQIIKRTHYKPGETYKVGDAIVTVHADKASMLAAIAATEARKAAKDEKLRERAIDIMLMTPEQLQQFKIEEWLKKRSNQESMFRKILGRFAPTKYEVMRDASQQPSIENKRIVASEKATVKVAEVVGSKKD